MDIKQFIRIVKRLPEQDQKTLFDLAEFLAKRIPQDTHEIPEPKIMPRPSQESVVQGLKRLSATYFMLEKAVILNKASTLMAQHIMQGRPASDVIDDLEVLFLDQYRKLSDKQS